MIFITDEPFLIRLMEEVHRYERESRTVTEVRLTNGEWEEMINELKKANIIPSPNSTQIELYGIRITKGG